ncbi:helix-turn-helix transcriptional regulator [Paenibacillus sp. CGMCC 1.16610]|uniref:Helix-turn-helix domain-containing protein n=1 Tax=Paenibacillus anseongense TaxID=2682845 RepID=A0ABW9UH41_9BACL|nr:MULTISPECIES: helix-turn-helix domain-containing protein [Paenibacillus]MBA2939837.1 helix-turn-helix transcriptional regulator [Paenibacillus sp. CGMCC 1.16610]MVQ39497.1 helix-turn-helix domain-containing protein [Paenibacillus anseongense]
MSDMTESQFAKISRALAEPRRFQILKEIRVAVQPLPCSVLLEAHKVSASTISHHLKELEIAGLIENIREGKNVSLIFKPEVLQVYLDKISKDLIKSLFPFKES